MPAEPRRLLLADIEKLAGEEIGVSDWLTIDQGMIDAFAELTGDRQWIHVDRERASSEIGGTLAHGFLTLALLSRLAAEIVRIEGAARELNYGFDRLRFTGAVPSGRAIRLRLVLKGVERKGHAFQLAWLATVEVEGTERPALVADWLTLTCP